MESHMFLILIFMQGLNISSTNLYGSNMKLDDLHRRYCPDKPTCRNNATMTIEDSVLNTSYLSMCCSSCSCEQDCTILDNCCLDKVAQMFTSHHSDIDSEKIYDKHIENIVHLYKQKVESKGFDDLIPMADTWLRSSCDDITIPPAVQNSQSLFSYYMVISCPPDYPRDTQEYKGCVLKNITQQYLTNYIPVSSSETLIAYRNKHCLACNENNASMYQWQTELHWEMNSVTTLPPITTLDDALQLILKQTGFYISFQPTQWSTEVLFLCEIIQISTCNVTGLWTAYDASIDAACTAAQSTFIATIKEFSNYSVSFRNIACYLCNIGPDGISEETCIANNFNLDNQTVSVVLNTGAGVFSYEVSFDFPKVILSQSEPDECGEGKLLDNSTGKCRDTYCPRDHVTNADYCSPLFNDIRGMTVGVKLRMKFQRYFFASILSDMDQSINTAFYDFFSLHGISICHASLWHKFKDDSKRELDFYFYHVLLEVDGHTVYSEIWHTLIALLERHPFGDIPDLTGYTSVGYQVTFADSIVMAKMNGLTKVWDDLDGKQLFAAQHTSQHSDNQCAVSISMGSTSFCERVALDKDEYYIQGQNLMLKHSTQTIHSGYFDISLDHKAFICIDEYKKRNVLITDNTGISNIEQINQNYNTETVSTNTSIYLAIIVTTVSICSVFLVAGFARKRCIQVQLSQQITIETTGEELQEIA